MKFLENHTKPGPVIWAYALAAPALSFAHERVWWAHWVFSALSWYLVLTWLWTVRPERWRTRWPRASRRS